MTGGLQSLRRIKDLRALSAGFALALVIQLFAGAMLTGALAAPSADNPICAVLIGGDGGDLDGHDHSGIAHVVCCITGCKAGCGSGAPARIALPSTLPTIDGEPVAAVIQADHTSALPYFGRPVSRGPPPT